MRAGAGGSGKILSSATACESSSLSRRAPPAAARSDLAVSFDDIPENAASVVFSHLGEDPIDRVRLAAVSKVWRSAEKAGASSPGTPRAFFDLGEGFYDEGEHEKALYWWCKAIDDRDKGSALFEIASCYYYFEYEGKMSVKRCLAKAFESYKIASELGHARATYKVALCYDFGTGVEQDDAKMVEWYVKAADLGDYCAAWQLSTIYEHGWRGVAVNKKEALKWCRVAAELEPHFAKDHQDRIVHLVREVATPRTNAA